MFKYELRILTGMEMLVAGTLMTCFLSVWPKKEKNEGLQGISH